ncbi:putative lipoprotein YiaD precursor [Methyloligella halotolerans]|uniref:Putative lipoprotein YiaD n=1 Tax=Methyloligella halotolerans TaxID=1177755 RepID=A0A1E2RUQ4_9HYPH|nr:OmpA family protein [Methyloligella halotolerans]ODA65986.1 putative lipoprotein YiaD precursor [Methyloligella halotolerans]
MTQLARFAIAGALFLFGAMPAFGQDACKDAEGLADFPNIPRYEGSCLIGYEHKSFEAYDLPTGPALKEDNRWTTESAIELEGEMTRLLYVAPADRSTLEVYRNYEKALKERGFETLFACSGEECGARPVALGQWVIYPRERAITTSGQFSSMAFTGLKDDHYLAARSKDGTTYVGLYIAQNNFSYFKQSYRHAIVHLDIVQVAAMEEKMVDAEAMAKSIAETGKVAVENIYFDFGKATLRPESDAALSEMAKLLTQHPEMSVYIVGHTDSVGAYKANLALSRARAEAVVAALASQHGIDRTRTIPAGVGPLAPVANNGSDDGRAKNRRVELVQR